MCHLILALPILALPVFWLLPLSVALPVYAVLTGFSAFVYWQTMALMHRPTQNGVAALIGDMGEVVGASDRELLVRVRSELWHATSEDGMLDEGDRIEIIGVAGKTLRVRRLDLAKRFFTDAPGEPCIRCAVPTPGLFSRLRRGRESTP